MKKGLWLISIIFVFSMTFMGCATKGDLEKMQAQDQQMNMKIDEALKSAQNANEAAARAEERAKIAEEKAKVAEEKAAKSDAAFKRSMKK
ncbi:MAG: hypothetical protein A4E66_00864 [Syntrophus sp. PtaB.Bin001]|nr:MAG: hypothetical protein A4E66_00864 [Syntrophus sp. PtaB.Bin001]